jgi:hypothetical protein
MLFRMKFPNEIKLWKWHDHHIGITFYNESLLKRIRDTQIKTYEKYKITRYESQPITNLKFRIKFNQMKVWEETQVNILS